MIKAIKIMSIIFACLGFFFILISILSGAGYPDYWVAITNSENSLDKISRGVFIFFLLSFALFLFGEYFEKFSE